MANIGELSVGVKVDQGSLTTATRKVKSDFQKTGEDIEQSMKDGAKKGAEGMRSPLSGIAGMLAGIFTVGAIVNFTKRLLQMGSDLEEVSAKFDVVFDGSQKVRQEFYDLADSVGRGRLDMLKFGADVGAVLDPLGLMQSEVDGMSLSLTQLALDVASFNNVSDDQALNAFTRALTGEREALKSLGIVILETDVQQKAYEIGLAKTGEQLTKQQRALATYQLLLENTKNAQGNATREAEGYASSLKGLQGSIKDAFAQAGSEVAKDSAVLLREATSFIKAYGKPILDTIINVGRVIGGVVKDVGGMFGDLFTFITGGTKENSNDMLTFATVFAKLVQGFGVGIRFIVTLFKTLGDIFSLVSMAIVEYGVATVNTIVKGWQYVSTAVTGTWKSMAQGGDLFAELIALTMVGLAEAIVGVFKGIADNVGVAIKKAGNVAIKGINTVIDYVNKIPGVSLDRLVEMGDADWKPFTTGFKKNLAYAQESIANFEKKNAENFAGMNVQFDDFGKANATMAKLTDAVAQSMADDWTNFAVETELSNMKVAQSLKEGEDNQKKFAEGHNKEFFDIMDVLDKYKQASQDATDGAKKGSGDAKKSIDTLKKAYDEWEKAMEMVEKESEKFADNVKKYNQDIEDSMRSLGNELSGLQAEFKKFYDETVQEQNNDLAERYAEVVKGLEEVDKDLASFKRDTKDDAFLSFDDYEKLVELEEKRNGLLQEQALLKEHISMADMDEALRYSNLSETEKIMEDARKKIDAKQQELDAETQRIESLQKINQYFRDLERMDQAEYDKMLKDEKFLAMTEEEQQLMLKLAREKMELTNQKDALIEMQQEIADATIELSNISTEVQQANIGKLKGEYATLIAQIDRAIQRQRELNALRGGGGAGFSSGGYTGDGGVSEVAGLVHKGEWVAPKWMVKSMKPLFDNLEGQRSRGFADGGYTSSVSKEQNNNITVNSGVDLRSFLDYAKWKL